MRKKMCTLDCKLKFLHNAFHPFKTRDFLMKANKSSKNRSAWRTVSQIHSHYICNCSIGNVTIVRLPKISVSLTCTKHSNKRYNLKLLWPWLDTRRLRKLSLLQYLRKKNSNEITIGPMSKSCSQDVDTELGIGQLGNLSLILVLPTQALSQHLRFNVWRSGLPTATRWSTGTTGKEFSGTAGQLK